MRTFLLPTIIIVSLFFSCHSQKEEVKNEPTEKSDTITLQKEFKLVLDDFIDLLKERSSETNIIVTISYRVFDNEYITLVNDFAYNSDFLKGYTVYKDYLICYIGVDDCIAEKIFWYENFKKDTPSKEYVNKKNMKDLHDILFDPTGRYYHIDDQNKIHPYKPSPEILQEFVNISVQHGFIRAVPPKPE